MFTLTVLVKSAAGDDHRIRILYIHRRDLLLRIALHAAQPG
jgi:hypothetical protein